MSASKQSTTRTSRRATDRDPNRWFVVSALLHLVAVLVLIYFTPLRDIIAEARAQRERLENVMSADALEDLAESIEELTRRQIRQNAASLDTIVQRINEVQREMQTEFQRFERQQQQNAADDALTEMQKAVDNMAEAVEKMEAGAGTTEIDRFQALAEQAQERATRKLEMVTWDVADVRKQQTVASNTHQEAKALHDQHRDLNVLDIANAKRALADRQADLDKRKDDLEKAKKSEPGDNRERAVKMHTERVAEATERVKEVEKTLAERTAAAAEKAVERAKVQAEALEKQKEAIAALEKQIAERPQTGASFQTAVRKIEGREDRNLEAMDVPDIYEASRDDEDDVAEVFKEVRAMDLAMVRDMKLEDARRDIDLVRPVRPDLNDELLRESVRTDEEFEAHKQELKTALRETSSMVNLAERMLEMAQQSVENMKFGSDAEAAMAELEEEEKLQLIIRELAMEDVSGSFSDMTSVMQTTTSEGAPPPPRIDYKDLTAEEEEAQEDAPQLSLRDQGEEAGAVPQLLRDLPALGARKIGRGGIPTDWVKVDTWYTLGPFPNPGRVNIDREYPPDSLIDLDATYRGKGGRTIGWQFMQGTDNQMRPPNPEEYGIWYAYTEIEMDEARDVLIACGTDDRGILKINGVPVWISSKRLKGWDIDEVWRKVHLKKGINRLLYRVENGWIDIGFSLVIQVPKD